MTGRTCCRSFWARTGGVGGDGEVNSRPEPFSGDHNERVRWFVLDRPNGHRHPAGRSSHVPLDQAASDYATLVRPGRRDRERHLGNCCLGWLSGHEVRWRISRCQTSCCPTARQLAKRSIVHAHVTPRHRDDRSHIDADAWHEGPPSRPQLDYSVASLRARPVFARVKDSIASRHNTMNPPCGGWRTRSARTGWPRDAGSTASSRRPSSLPRWLAARTATPLDPIDASDPRSYRSSARTPRRSASLRRTWTRRAGASRHRRP